MAARGLRDKGKVRRVGRRPGGFTWPRERGADARSAGVHPWGQAHSVGTKTPARVRDSTAKGRKMGGLLAKRWQVKHEERVARHTGVLTGSSPKWPPCWTKEATSFRASRRHSASCATKTTATDRGYFSPVLALKILGAASSLRRVRTLAWRPRVRGSFEPGTAC